jgi:hypothetical protein
MSFWRCCFRQRQQTLREHLRQAQASRSLWLTLKLFPQCFGVVPSEDQLTDSQWTWIHCQILLDEGAQACAACDALGIGRYCHACGRSLRAESLECPVCQQMGNGKFCTHCGEALRSSVAEAIQDGTFDWDGWLRDMQPFLGGLTMREQQVMLRDNLRYGSQYSQHNGMRG